MKLLSLLKNKDVLELIKKILSESALGNSLAFVLATLAKNTQSVPVFKYFMPLTFICSALIVLLWMAALVGLYFKELEGLIGKSGTWLMIAWALTFECAFLIKLLSITSLLN